MNSFEALAPFSFIAAGLALTPVAYLMLVAWPLARTDLRERRLPNSLTLPGLGLGLVAQTLASLVLGFGALSQGLAAGQSRGQGRAGGSEGQNDWVRLLGHSFANQGGALASAAAVFALSLAAHVWADLGMGDVKLLTVIALSLGWFNPWSPLLAVMVGLAAAVAVATLNVARRRAKLSSTLPLGPYLLLGFFAACAVLAAGVATPASSVFVA